MARHIFLTGKKQIGKSTLLQKILKNYQGTADGFLTVRTKEYLGDQYSVHMYHPNVEIITLSESNRNNSSLCEHILSDF